MTELQPLPPTSLPAELVLADAWVAPVNQHPAKHHLAGLAESGRRSQEHGLEVIARFLSHGELGWDVLPWRLVRMEHAKAVHDWLKARSGFKRRDGGIAPATANAYQSALRRVMEACFDLEMISGDDLKRIRKPLALVKGSRQLAGRALRDGEMTSIYEALEDAGSVTSIRDAALVAVMYSSGGVRRAEAIRITMADLDQDSQEVRVIGKGNKERLIHLGDETMQAIEAWLDVRGQGPGWLFSPIEKDRKTPDLFRQLSAATVWQVCRRRGAQAGIKKFSPHDLRRSSISDMLDKTGDLATVSELAGHSDPATTLRYDRRSERRRRKVAMTLQVPYRRPAR